jgi:hypothetical protein
MLKFYSNSLTKEKKMTVLEKYLELAYKHALYGYSPKSSETLVNQMRQLNLSSIKREEIEKELSALRVGEQTQENIIKIKLLEDLRDSDKIS